MLNRKTTTLKKLEAENVRKVCDELDRRKKWRKYQICHVFFCFLSFFLNKSELKTRFTENEVSTNFS